MHRDKCFRSAAALLCASVVQIALSAESSRNFFKYATLLQTPPVSSPTLAELPFTDEMYAALRKDSADLRIISLSAGSVVPVKVAGSINLSDGKNIHSRRSYVLADAPPADLAERYVDSSILAFKSQGMPVNGLILSLEPDMPCCSYMLMGQGGVHAAGAEWRLLTKGRVAGEEGIPAMANLAFPESRCFYYAIVFDDKDAAGAFSVKSVTGPDYSAYFQLQPGEKYMLLCGYPDASPVAAYNTGPIDRLQKNKEVPVKVHVGALKENEDWRGMSLRKLAYSRSFLIPLAAVAAVVLVLLIFVMVYSFINRKRPVKSEPRLPFLK